MKAVRNGATINNSNGNTNIIIAIAAEGGNVHINAPEANFTSFGNGVVKIAKITDSSSSVKNYAPETVEGPADKKEEKKEAESSTESSTKQAEEESKSTEAVKTEAATESAATTTQESVSSSPSKPEESDASTASSATTESNSA